LPSSLNFGCDRLPIGFGSRGEEENIDHQGMDLMRPDPAMAAYVTVVAISSAIVSPAHSRAYHHHGHRYHYYSHHEVAGDRFVASEWRPRHPPCPRSPARRPSFPTPIRDRRETQVLESLTERNMLQMSQVLGRDRKPSRPQARDIAEAVAHQTLQAGHAILLRRRVRR
jgi:hypothetical protein